MPKPPKPEFTVPPTVGAAVDLLYTTRQTRLVEQKDIEAFKEREKVLKDHLIATLPKSDSTGQAGKVARATITKKTVPAVEDWDLVYKWVKRKNRFDLLQRRLNEAAIQELWDAGVKVPGVGTFTVVDVSVTKL